MRKSSAIELDFVIDKLTNSIENVQTGDNFPTEISLLSASELKNITKKNGWNFNLPAGRQVGNPNLNNPKKIYTN